jgi:type I site-specific restriction endonuclease
MRRRCCRLVGCRKRLRNLIRLIEKTRRQPIYTNFIDELGSETTIDIEAFGRSDEFDRFRAKARQFLLAPDHHGIMDAGLLSESPFTDINSQGPEGIFSQQQVDGLVTVFASI